VRRAGSFPRTRTMMLDSERLRVSHVWPSCYQRCLLRCVV
jgi:hypothetical protein